jgi:hypothetical protein
LRQGARLLDGCALLAERLLVGLNRGLGLLDLLLPLMLFLRGRRLLARRFGLSGRLPHLFIGLFRRKLKLGRSRLKRLIGLARHDQILLD